MGFKNYYKTLGVSPQASLDQIKKKFRKLAKEYHPDTNTENEFTSLHFTELQEAYETLSHPARRTKYDFEWKLHFPFPNVPNGMQTPETNPFSLLEHSIRLNKKIANMDRFRMNREAVSLSVNEILSEININILLRNKDNNVNEQLIAQLISASSVLSYRHIMPIAASLKRLAGKESVDLQLIESFVKKARWEHYWQKFYPLLVLLITSGLCVAIYLLSD